MSDDEMLGQRLITLGLQSQALKDNEAFDLAVRALEQEVIREWVTADSVGARERAHSKINVMQELVDRLDEIIGEGAMELEKVRRAQLKADAE